VVREAALATVRSKLAALGMPWQWIFEIRIRDNGTGILPEVKEKLFSPFLTTKPAGEGTGLGLSIGHDIIVKQHGGSIEAIRSPALSPNFRSSSPGGGVPYQGIERAA
jgi:signal transduction histidine kinase